MCSTMEPSLQRKVSFENSQQHSCMWGIFHLFHLHQKFHPRMMISDRNHGSGKHAGGRSTKIKPNAFATHGTLDFADPQVDSNHLVEESKAKSSRATKKSGQSRIKSLIAKEMSKKRDRRKPSTSLPSRLQRLYSIHHMEGDDFDIFKEQPPPNGESTSQIEQYPYCSNSDHDSALSHKPNNLVLSCKSCGACGTPNAAPYTVDTNLAKLGQQLLEKQAMLHRMLGELKRSLSNKILDENNEVSQHAGLAKSKEILDVLEMFNTNQELFVKILEDQSSVMDNHFHGLSPAQMVFTKSGSFPGAGLSSRQNVKPPGPKYEPLDTGSPAKRRVESKPSKVCEIAEVDSENSKSPPSSRHQLKKSRLKSIKQKITHVITGAKKERCRISMDGILHKIPYGHDANEEFPSISESHNKDSPSSISCGSVGPTIKRSASLSESLDRYSQLFYSIQRKPNLSHSKTLKLSGSVNENDSSYKSTGRRSFGRVRSLPNFHFFQLDGNAEIEKRPPCTLHQKMPEVVLKIESNNQSMIKEEHSRLSCSINSENEQANSGDLFHRSFSQKLVSDEDGIERGQDCCITDSVFTVEETGYIPLSEHRGTIKAITFEPPEPSPISVLNSSIQEYISIPESPSSTEEVFTLKTSTHKMTVQDELSLDEVECSTSSNEAMYLDTVLTRVDTRDDPDFKYVSDILQISGFTSTELLGTWYSADQPMDPSLYDEIEASPVARYEPSHAFASFSSSDHMVLFDLINEVLLDIYDRSYTPLPSLPSSKSLSRPIPVGHQVLDEVWSQIRWHLDLQPDANTSLEEVMTRDFSKYDGWMKLPMDTEAVGLELGDWILDDMLDEELFELVH